MGPKGKAILGKSFRKRDIFNKFLIAKWVKKIAKLGRERGGRE